MVVAAPRSWVEPDTDDVEADAFAEISGELVSVSVAVAAPAGAEMVAAGLCALDLVAEVGELVGEGELGVFPNPVAGAELVLQPSGEAIQDYFISAPAPVVVDADFGVVVDYVFAISVFSALDFESVFVEPEAVATVSVVDDGSTSDYEQWVVGANRPEFPFNFPAEFTDLSNAKSAEAAISVEPGGSLDAVGAVADSRIELSREGVAEVLGLIQPFPFSFPLVFGVATGFLAVASVRINTGDVLSVSLDGSAQFGISAESDAFNNGFFPWNFPIIV